MSQRYGIAGQQYLDNNGDPLSGGKLNFYQPSTVVRKNTYTDSGEGTPNANPVVLDQYGRQTDIWFTGQAKVVLTDSDDNEIDTTDPVGSASASVAFSAWSSTTTYDAGSIVTASNDLLYRSIGGGNLNNEPSANLNLWEEIRFTGDYNASVTYNADDVVESGGILYISRVGSNSGNTPATSPTQWRPLNAEVWVETTVKTANFIAVAGRHYLCDTNAVGAFNMTMPESPTAGDKVGFTDYAGNFGAANLTVARAPISQDDIMGLAEDMAADVTYFSGELLYVDATQGWILT